MSISATHPSCAGADATRTARISPGDAAVARLAVNNATTSVFAEIMRLHEPVPVHPPDHPTKVELTSGIAVTVNGVPSETASMQSAPQSIPAGILTILPEPLPVRETV